MRPVPRSCCSRRGNRVEAVDGSCVADDTGTSNRQRLARILDCVAAAASVAPDDWQALVTSSGLAARIDEGWVWVCLDGCERE